jgi:hypothetical protein
MKHIKLFEQYRLIREKNEPKSEVDHKTLYKYLSPVLDKDGKSVSDSESYNKLVLSKGKKLDLSNFIESEKPTPTQLDKLPEALKKLEIGIYDESWSNMIEHPQDIITLQKYFVKKDVITNEQLIKMPDFQSTLKSNIKSDPTTWSKENYNKIQVNQKYDDDLSSVIQYLANQK